MRRLVCAVYTRKSTEEGLDMAFNSLDAQREACEAYIRSQRAEGWILSPAAYDDGGFSGGSMQRAALQRLLDDVRAGRVDVIVVYKVDRLTRSLSDFAKIVDVLDAAGASFVSVTQSFNTTSSMGRLTLNVLLSFAQFEREVIAERVRDKVAASRAKGMWMGGTVPFGYEVKDRKLVPHDTEAATVRHIFARYLALGAVRPLAAELARDGIRNRERRGRNGETEARPFTRGPLYWMLRNPVYAGEVVHKGNRYPGEQPALVERATWDAVQAHLDAAKLRDGAAVGAADLSWLMGRLRDPWVRPLTPTATRKGTTRHRYYASVRGAVGEGGQPVDAAAVRVSAPAIEKAVCSAVGRLLEPTILLDIIPSSPDIERLLARAGEVGLRFREGDASARAEISDQLGLRLVVSPTSVQGWVSLAGLAAVLGENVEACRKGEELALDIPTATAIRAKSKKLVFQGSSISDPNPALVELVARARRTRDRVFAGEIDPANVHARRMMRLAYLSPAIVVAIIEGRQPRDLTATTLFRMSGLSLSWREQERAVGLG